VASGQCAMLAAVAECILCQIGRKQAEAVVLYEDADIMTFLDIGPIRSGHTQIIPKEHFETFELLPPDLAGRIVVLGQFLARKMKAVYRVNRVAFVFTGGDISHAHAHVIPMLEKTDITSARYIVNPQDVRFASEHLAVDRETLLQVRRDLDMQA
jgi:histidine triad (HIT) family protein